tara:strand:- start:23537 stop:24058 length:522 start_codon:yes stop_codon:yes gene_type:complete
MAEQLLANAYQRKYYDVEVELDISAQCTKRIYVDEIEQYTNDMNKEMLLTYGIDKNYQHEDEFNPTNEMLAEDLALEEVEEEDWMDNMDVHNMEVYDIRSDIVKAPIQGEETDGEKIWQCVYCKEHFTGFGNNPETVGKMQFSEDAECCDACNTNIVIPERMKDIMMTNHLGV